jgi:hypothetical protein
MPVPPAALSSCTSRLGMSTAVGMALPTRSTSAKSRAKLPLAPSTLCARATMSSRAVSASARLSVSLADSARLGESSRNQ